MDKISLYGICYRVLPYLQQSLDSIKDPRLDITIVESESQPEIREYLAVRVADKTISRAVCFKNNVRGLGLIKALELFPPASELVVLTDLDLVVPNGVDWLSATLKAHEEGNVYTGFPLSLENEPPNSGHDPNFAWGLWLSCMRWSLYQQYYPKSQNIRDRLLHSVFSAHGPVKRLDDCCSLRHLTWDVYTTPGLEWYSNQKKAERGWFPSEIWEIDTSQYEIIQ